MSTKQVGYGTYAAQIKVSRQNHLSIVPSLLLFLCPYYWDIDRKQVLEFKNSKESTIRKFISESINNLLSHQMSKELVIVRALGSNEMEADTSGEKSLDRLGNSLAASFGCVYLPLILRKTKFTKPIKSLNLTNRQKMLADVYEVNGNYTNLNLRKVLIIDDVVTTGVTSCAIISAILKGFPAAKINVFSLAWTPTLTQQTYLVDMQNKTFHFNEPEPVYGKKKRVSDEDFESGKTHISLF